MDRPYAVGIVGSRRRNTLTDRRIVIRLVCWLHDRERGGTGFAIVSGGCPEGADAFAKTAANLFDPPLQMVEFPINKEGIDSKWEFTKRAYARNRLVAEKSSELYCLVHPDRTGGTENTIRFAIELGTPVFIIDNNGCVFRSTDGAVLNGVQIVDLLTLAPS